MVWSVPGDENLILHCIASVQSAVCSSIWDWRGLWSYGAL